MRLSENRYAMFENWLHDLSNRYEGCKICGCKEMIVANPSLLCLETRDGACEAGQFMVAECSRCGLAHFFSAKAVGI